MTQLTKEVYKEEEEYLLCIETAKTEVGEKFAFLHLDVYTWNKSVFKQLQQDLEDILKMCKKKKYDLCGFYLEKGGSTKFHKKMKPLDFLVKKEGHLFGGWFLED